MEVIRDDLCFILDLEGFFINKTFHVRELGYYTWNEEHGRHAFRIPVPRQDLAQKDKQTVNFVIRKIHGLSYQPSQAEHPSTLVSYPGWFKICTEITVPPTKPWWDTRVVTWKKIY